MKLILSLLLAMSANAFAGEKLVLMCSTPGDALDAVQLIQAGDKSLIRVSYLNDTFEDFVIETNLKNIVAKQADTLVGTSSKSIEFGGAVSDAVLLRVMPGQKRAVLASGGTVYKMNCFKQ
jgi:hypothetical protein